MRRARKGRERGEVPGAERARAGERETARKGRGGIGINDKRHSQNREKDASGVFLYNNMSIRAICKVIHAKRIALA